MADHVRRWWTRREVTGRFPITPPATHVHLSLTF